jgi:hypothetical protein
LKATNSLPLANMIEEDDANAEFDIVMHPEGYQNSLKENNIRERKLSYQDNSLPD